MASPFEAVAQKLLELGFYDYLIPFILTSAIFYALLKRTKILGESPVINGVISISIGFLMFILPAIFGVSLAFPFTRFFGGATVWILVFVVGFLLAGLFYPDLGKMLGEAFTRRTSLYVMLVIALSLFITSGFITVFTSVWSPSRSGTPGGGQTTGIPTDLIILTVGIILFIVFLIIAGAITRGGI